MGFFLGEDFSQGRRKKGGNYFIGKDCVERRRGDEGGRNDIDE